MALRWPWSSLPDHVVTVESATGSEAVGAFDGRTAAQKWVDQWTAKNGVDGPKGNCYIKKLQEPKKYLAL